MGFQYPLIIALKETLPALHSRNIYQNIPSTFTQAWLKMAKTHISRYFQFCAHYSKKMNVFQVCFKGGLISEGMCSENHYMLNFSDKI